MNTKTDLEKIENALVTKEIKRKKKLEKKVFNQKIKIIIISK